MNARRAIAVLACGVLALSACAGDDEDEAATPTETTAPSGSEPSAEPSETDGEYAGTEAWLCRPGHDEVCVEDMDVQVIEADGSSEVQEFQPDADAPVDCFYVYPTVSDDPGENSDLVPNDNEINTVRTQAARLGSECRLFAPVYRQVTLTTLLGLDGGDEEDAATEDADDEGAEGDPFAGDPGEIAYESLLSAWEHYLEHDNDGRGIVLVGHSQGSGVLARLIAEEVDGDDALRDQLVSAILLGTSLPEDEFENIDVCATADETGCVASWSTYRSTVPPPDNGIFARGTDESRAVCTNPADLDDGRTPLTPYFETVQSGIAGIPTGDADTEWVDPAVGDEVTEPWVALPGLVEGECVEQGPFHYLEITVVEDDGPRIDEIGGDITPEWGLHLVDANLAMGELLELVRNQIDSYVES